MKNPLSTGLLDSLVYNSIIGAGMSPVKGGNEYAKIDIDLRIYAVFRIFSFPK